jgi:TonB family protein
MTPEDKVVRRHAGVVRLAAAMLLLVVSVASSGPRVHGQSQTVYRPGPGSGVTLPRVVKEVKPAYTSEAMQAKVHGSVWLKAVVLDNGKVGEITIDKSLDQEHGLDEAAVTALRQWEFTPGTKDGKPVAVEITVELTFTLEK